MQPMQAHLSVNFRNKNCEHKCSGVRFFLGQILKCSPVVSSYFQCLWISSYKPWQRMTQQIHDAAPDLKCRRSVLVPKCAAQSQQKVILTAQKSYRTKCHCIALQVCIFAIALTPFSISYLRNLIVKLAPLKLCDIAAAKSKATWVEITPERYCFFLVRSRPINIWVFY